MNELFHEFVHEHKVMTAFFGLVCIGALVCAVGTYYFDWDLIQIAMDTKDTVIQWVYTPFNRSFGDLKDSAQW